MSSCLVVKCDSCWVLVGALLCPAGGGHKASAEALKQAMEEKYGDKFKVTVVALAAHRSRTCLALRQAGRAVGLRQFAPAGTC